MYRTHKQSLPYVAYWKYNPHRKPMSYKKEDDVIEKVIKWTFWIILIVYLLAGHLQIRYWIGKSFGWQFNDETESLEVGGFGQIVEYLSLVISFLILYGVYYLWKEVSKNNDWEPLFKNTRKIFVPKNLYTSIKSFLAFIAPLLTVLAILGLVGAGFFIIISLVTVLLPSNILRIAEYVLLGFYGLLMVALFIIGKDK